jgi:hypothetical protein
MQIGADVYCDSNGIARELGTLPSPSFRTAVAALELHSACGAIDFSIGAGLAMSVNAELPADLVKDRREFFSPAGLRELGTHGRAAHRRGAR